MLLSKLIEQIEEDTDVSCTDIEYKISGTW